MILSKFIGKKFALYYWQNTPVSTPKNNQNYRKTYLAAMQFTFVSILFMLIVTWKWLSLLKIEIVFYFKIKILLFVSQTEN